MIQYEELKFELKNNLPALTELADALNLDGLKEESAKWMLPNSQTAGAPDF